VCGTCACNRIPEGTMGVIAERTSLEKRSGDAAAETGGSFTAGAGVRLLRFE